MTFSAVGSTITISATTFTLAPSAVGNFVIVDVTGDLISSVPSSLSSSNATWAKLGTVGTTDGGSPFNPSAAQCFIGTVTSTTSATVTISWTGVTPGLIQGSAHEFSSTVGASSVTLDVQATLNADAGTTTWPSLTPGHGAGELYYGYAIDASTASGGSTSGYTYSVDASGNGTAFNVSCPNSATAPVWGDAHQVFGVMVLVYEAAGAAAAGKLQPWATVPVPRRRPARAVIARIIGRPPPAAPNKEPPLIPRPRPLRRAIIQRITGQPPPAAPNKEPPPPPRPRPPRRAIVLSIIGRPPPAAPNREPPPGPRPRPPRRAVVLHVTGTFPPAAALGTPNREPLQPQRSRPPQRAITRSITGSAPSAVTRAYRQPPGLPSVRRPARAVVLSVQPQPVVAAAAAPSGMRDRRPGYLKKRVLFGV